MDHDNPVPCFSIRWSCMAFSPGASGSPAQSQFHVTLRVQRLLSSMRRAHCIECTSLWLQQEHAVLLVQPPGHDSIAIGLWQIQQKLDLRKYLLPEQRRQQQR